MSTTIVYNLDNYLNISSNYKNSIINESIINLINDLSSQVTSPTYNKTPLFNEKRKKKKNPEPTSNGEWNAVRNFKSTVIAVEKHGIDKDLDEIRLLLNKLTEKTYDKIKLKFITMFEENNYSDEDCNKIGQLIFTIAGNNKYNSANYAKLIDDIKQHLDISTLLSTNITIYIELFKNMTFACPDEDYDLFCKINVINENRRSLTLFIIYLINNKIIVDDVNIVQNNIINLINEYYNNEQYKSHIEEITENLLIYINNINPTFMTDIVINDIRVILNKLLKENNISVSNKTKFKCMDITDVLNKKYK